MVTLGKMERCHLAEIVALEKICFSNPWTYEGYRFELEDNKLAQYLVALEGEKVVAYGGMWIILGEAHVTNLAVHPDYRRRGLGEMLMHCLMARAYGAGARHMTLEVRQSNRAAQKLYEKLGFKGVGHRRGYYSDNQEDALIMWKGDLGPLGEEADVPTNFRN